jgi:hypothetical protein
MTKELTKEDLLEEIRNINFEIADAINNDDKKKLEKNRILLNNLIKIYEVK